MLLRGVDQRRGVARNEAKEQQLLIIEDIQFLRDLRNPSAAEQNAVKVI